MKSYIIKPNFDRGKLKRLLTELVETHGKSKTISEKIEKEVLIGKNTELLFSTLVQFSKWCHTGHSYKDGEKIARKISKLLFGEIIPRLD